MKLDRHGRLEALKQRFVDNVISIRGRAMRVTLRSHVEPPRLRLGEWLAIALAAAVTVLVIGVAFDRISIDRARALPGVVVDVLRIVSDAGKSQWELYPAGILVLVLLLCRWQAAPRFARVFWAEVGALSAFVFASIGGIGILVNIVKQPIGRGRPPTFDMFGAFTLQPLHFAYEFQSFPSGHSATGGALIALGFLVFTRWRIGLLLFGLAIGASRVAVGAHYPSDVAAGLIVGFAFTMWLSAVFARYGWAFHRGATGTIRARSGAIRRVSRSPARIVIVLASLVDAPVGRPLFIPALASIGDGSYGRTFPRVRPIDEA